MTASRELFTVKNSQEREKIIRLVRDCPWKTRVMFIEPQRTPEQNNRLWLMLDCISEQVLWYGQRYLDSEWKDYFMHALRGEKWMPLEEGGMIPIGRSTSKLSVAEFGELMEVMEAFAARHSVFFPWTEKMDEPV